MALKEEREYFDGFPGAKKPVPGLIPIDDHPAGYLTDHGKTELPLTWAGCMTEHEPDAEAGEEKAHGTD